MKNYCEICNKKKLPTVLDLGMHPLCDDLIKIGRNIKNKFQIYHNEIDNHRIIKSVIDKNLLFRLHQNYHSKAIDILNEINPEKVKLYDYSDFTIIVTNKDVKFPIHDDTPNKLLLFDELCKFNVPDFIYWLFIYIPYYDKSNLIKKREIY